MNGDKAWELIHEICEQYTVVPTKRIKKLARYLAIENAHLKKDNKHLRKKIKRLNAVKGEKEYRE